jgi:HlyD family secretion protein
MTPHWRDLARLGAGLMLLAACRKEQPDAYGNFEAEEVVVSAEGAGRLLAFEVEEGKRLAAGAMVGTIDTMQLALQRRDLLARRVTARTRVGEVGQQVNVLESQRELAKREYERTQRLLQQQAATAQQLDRAERDYRTLGEQIEATRATRATAATEIGSIDAQVAQIEDRIRKSRIENPTAGTVLARYTEPGEFVQPGQALYKVANLDTLTLRAYVSGAQLAAVRLGQSVQVRIDAARDSLETISGLVTWVASQAEFTPTPVQTRDERADQVYAVKIRVANPNGALKIGMPAELVLPSVPPPRA